MKNTTIKILCIFLLGILSVDAYSQLKSPKDPDDGTGKCWNIYSNFDYCPEFTLPTELLTFDLDSPDEYGCFPVNNFGCDLHIGLTYDGDESTTVFKKITSCDVVKINAANANTSDVFIHWPAVCISIPVREDMCDVDLTFSFNLYCKDGDDFTPISEIASLDHDNNWDDVFPGNEPKSVIGEDSWTTKICCKDPVPITPGGPGGNLTPIIGQDDDGSTAFVRNLKDVDNVSISVFDANYQSIDISNNLSIVSNSEYSINLSNLNQGVYFIRVVEDGIMYSQSIVKL